MEKNICVFCSSSEVVDIKYFNIAFELALEIANRNDILVYGGAKVGLMGKIAKTVKENSGKVIGVIPEVIKNKGLAYDNLDELIVTSTMHERKSKLEDLADSFIALPGGFGTLEEILEVITLKQLEYHTKPIVILNTDNFYSKLLEQFEKLYEEDFSKSDYRSIYFVANSVEEAFNYIDSYKYNSTTSKWYKTNLNL